MTANVIQFPGSIEDQLRQRRVELQKAMKDHTLPAAKLGAILTLINQIDAELGETFKPRTRGHR